ncbi:hypothetical protein BAE44_0023062 [Dichanthelium oligosanthes]|uniref:Uncharacterized protein n=1 Tax=Dichanthelium oligosanthes TaxID=888268 RepID=A0A1E5UST0_9POAL|nr:hypothetical protein BAE44_0023062 [Dichanthelium oligosanthes]
MLVAESVPSLVILESNCASVITSLTTKQDDRSRDMHILKENAVAHELAQLAKRMDCSAVWRHELLASDCNLTII